MSNMDPTCIRFHPDKVFDLKGHWIECNESGREFHVHSKARSPAISWLGTDAFIEFNSKEVKSPLLEKWIGPWARALVVYISLNWYDIPEFMVPVIIYLIEGCCYQGSYPTNGS